MSWSCSVCGATEAKPRWVGTGEARLHDANMRPSSQQFGSTLGRTLECVACGHVSLAEPPRVEVLGESYEDAVDPVSVREEPGQVATAHRTLEFVEQFVAPGRLADLGCWTGSLLVGARERGWEGVGVEPSLWASARARERGLDVRTAEWSDHGLDAHAFRLVALCDVLEHLVDIGGALEAVGRLVEPGGVVLLTLPDAGSRLARVLGRRWWSVLPMHVQYFTRDSIRRLLEARGFEVLLVRTHPKVFSAEYYAERLAGYSGAVERLAQMTLRATKQSRRLVAPDFRDRMMVVARPA
jgi:SAM-dependent methyltransferase